MAVCLICENPEARTVDSVSEEATFWTAGAHWRGRLLALLGSGQRVVPTRLVDCPTCGRYPAVILALPADGSRYLRPRTRRN